MPENELTSIYGWIYTKLSGSNVITTAVGNHPEIDTYNIYTGKALQRATYPLILVKLKANDRTMGNSGIKLMGKYWLDIMAVDNEPTIARIAPLADEIESLFHQSQAEVNDPIVLGCSCIESVNYEDERDGVRYIFLGSKVQIHATVQE